MSPDQKASSAASRADRIDEEAISRGLWDVAGALWNSRWLIVATTTAVAVLAIVISLLLPNWYQAEARVIKPESGGGGAASLLRSVVPGAASLLGGGGGDYLRYLAILTSQSMMGETVERFNLEEVYETVGKRDARGLAIEELRENTTFEVAMDYDYLAVRVLDKDPERAAEIANYMVTRLNEEHARLTSQGATQNRAYIETRLNEVNEALASARAELQAFQEQHGVIELEQQAGAFLSGAAEMQAQVTAAEIRYRSLAAQYGEENPQVQAARQQVQAARQQVRQMMQGRADVMPLAVRELPELSRRYAELIQDQMVQAELLPTIYALYEQAQYQERSEAMAVQILDRAVPPLRKAKPRRSVLVIAATLSGFLLTVLFVIIRGWIRQTYPIVRERLDLPRHAPA